jgi:hypothetical protein
MEMLMLPSVIASASSATILGLVNNKLNTFAPNLVRQTELNEGAVVRRRRRGYAVVSFDYRVGAGEQIAWERKAERLGGLDVDDQLDFRNLLHRQIGRFFPLENAAGINTG